MTAVLPEILYKGSVKNVRGNDGEDHVFFEFSDRYSIFDWGEMPDLIEGKGESLATFTDAIYSFLENSNSWKGWTIPDTYNKYVVDALQSSEAFKRLHDNGMTTHRFPKDARLGNCWKVKKVNVPEIKNKNYEFYLTKPVNTLVPLEVIFRFGTPSGSSLLKRLKKNPDYMYSLGLKQAPQEMDFFDRPVIEFSTKLESSDRYISAVEAMQMAGLSQEEFSLLQNYAAILAINLRENFAKMDLELWDGKFEFSTMSGLEHRDFMLVDSIGPDEVRLTYQNMHLSKEVLRQVYVGSDWHTKIDEYKLKSDNWQKEMNNEKLEPALLSKDVKKSVVAMYGMLATSVDSFFAKGSIDKSNFISVVDGLKKSLSEENK